MKGSWFQHHSRPLRATRRLFCFPYAGGNAHLFRSWVELLPPTVEVIGIQAPGKGSRALEAPCTSVRELTDGLMQALRPLLQDKPFSFFGHSNGALVAFELSCALQQQRLPTPQHLFLSASPAPWTRVIERPYSRMSDAEFKTVLKDMNGTPAEVLDDPGLFELVLPGLRADFSLAENYRYAWPQKLAVPTSVYYGEEDEISEAQIHAWQEQIRPTARFERMPDGHFFIHSQTERLVGSVARQLTELERNTARALAVSA